MFAVPFDLERLETRGTAVPILDDVAYDPVANATQFDVSRTGTLVYRKSSAAGPSTATVQWLDPIRQARATARQAWRVPGTPRLSPRWQAHRDHYSRRRQSGIWIYDLQRDAMTRLGFGGGAFSNPVWSRDGRYVVFASLGGGLPGVAPTVPASRRRCIRPRVIQFPTSFTRDGTRLAYVQSDGFPQIWSVPIESGGGGLKAGKPARLPHDQVHRFRTPRSRPTADGSLTVPTSPENSRSTFGHFPRARRRATADG